MRYSATEVIRRGFENMVANWPLLLIRIAEGVLLMIVAVAAIVAAIVPVAVSLGLNAASAQNPEDLAELMVGVLADRWMVILYLFAVATILLITFVAVHSFVEAGSARVYVDGERAAGATPQARRPQFRMFSMERWLGGGKQDWWPVFWIYNVAWGAAGFVILAPLLVVAALMVLLHDNAPLMLGVTCLGLLVSLFVLVLVAVVTNVWCQKAIVVCVARTHRTTGALGQAWGDFRRDAGRHIAVALVLFLLMIVGSGVFASISFVGGMSDSPGFVLAMMPMQLIGTLANTVFSAMIGAWFLACFAALDRG
ncbi:MAG TPA: hypothetical protein VNA04_10415 [Thermoanaerobaculia bacterium]|nr:hypothetical protein [Thermoanaerobaculia bacterium]